MKLTKRSYFDVHSPKWVNNHFNAIHCFRKHVKFHGESSVIAVPYDKSAENALLFWECYLGVYGPVLMNDDPNLIVGLTKDSEESMPSGPKKILGLSDLSNAPVGSVALVVPEGAELTPKLKLLEKMLLTANKELATDSIHGQFSIWGSIIEDLFRRLLKEKVSNNAARGNFTSMINKAFEVELIDAIQSKRAHAIRHSRNFPAHEWDLSSEDDKKLQFKKHLRELFDLDHADLYVSYEDTDKFALTIYSGSALELAGALADLITDDSN